MKTQFNQLAAGLAVALLSVSAFAASDGTMAVTASIAPECSVGNITPLAFGALSMLNNGARSTVTSTSTGGSFDAICTAGGTTPTLKFTSANAGGGTDFRLKGADNTTYIVYTLAESGGTAITHDTAAGFTNFVADGAVKSLAIAGSIAAGERDGKAAQLYGDTITITSAYGL
jgi:spore coat protein U-like protein